MKSGDIVWDSFIAAIVFCIVVVIYYVRKAAIRDTRIFYGPHLCERCGVMICKAAREQGGEEYTYPSGPIYPNTVWDKHECPGVGNTANADWEQRDQPEKLR